MVEKRLRDERSTKMKRRKLITLFLDCFVDLQALFGLFFVVSEIVHCSGGPNYIHVQALLDITCPPERTVHFHGG